MRRTDPTKLPDKGLKPTPTTNTTEGTQRDLECRYRRFRGTLNNCLYMVTWVARSQ
jgi:hypothetical protein